MSISASYPTLRPTLLLDFANSGRLDPRVTFSRASTATYFDATGTLQSAAIDTPRFDYNPSTLAARGFLIEEARTNSIRNNTMQGAVAGTPGTLPTNWSVLASNGLATNVIGTGVQNGITYVDLQVVGTSSGAFYVIAFDSVGAATTTVGISYTASLWFAIAGGSTANITYLVYQARQIGGANPITSENISGTSLSRFTNAVITTAAGVTNVTSSIAIGFSSGVAIDITLRIGLPQLELGAFATSVIPTTTTALTRSADVASVNTLSPWYNASEGTLYAELMRSSLIASTGFANAWSISNNTNNERFISYNTGLVQTMDAAATDGGVAQATLVASGSITANTTIKTAFAYAVNDFAFVHNAGTVQTDTSGTLPTVDRLYIGANSIGTGQWTGWIRRLTAYPRRLSNAELQAITA